MNTNKPQPDADIDREAADWVVRWEDGERAPGGGETQRWFEWLRRSPRHVQAYFDAADLHERLGGMDPDNRIDVDEWLTEKRAPVAAIGANIDKPAPAYKQRRSTVRRTLPAALAASSVAAAVALAWHLFGDPTYRTDTGQQSLYTLSDGSVLSLNTRSKARVKYSDRERLIELEGEALFSVARDPQRPFSVHTRGATVRAVGTQFNVYQHLGETHVAVVEGAVQVSSQNSAGTPQAAPLLLTAGQGARVTGSRVNKQAATHVAAATAWQQRKLVFEDASLNEVAAEFNRYNRIQIHFDDDSGAGKRLSGTFDALNPQSLVIYLQKDPELNVSRDGDVFSIQSEKSRARN